MLYMLKFYGSVLVISTLCKNKSEWLERYLSSLQVKRVEKLDDFKSKIKKFNHHNHENTLVKYLENNALDEDKKNFKAVYLIQDSNDFPIAFFSLRSGLLYRPKIKHADLISAEIDRYIAKLDELIQDSYGMKGDEEIIDLITEAIGMLKRNYLYDTNVFRGPLDYVENPDEFSEHLRSSWNEYVKSAYGRRDSSVSEVKVLDHILELCDINSKVAGAAAENIDSEDRHEAFELLAKIAELIKTYMAEEDDENLLNCSSRWLF